ncbi:MAG: aldo/keto reductase [Lachnospiraceae bacterium]|nr:aldo/keto reductase [Lachnospiraceae bacterium]
MKYLEFGPEKDLVSVIGAGCMRIAGMTEDAVEAFVLNAVDHEINFFDHADIYGGGKSELLFGSVLKKHPSLREKIFIQSKCAIHDGLFDFDRDYILKSVDGILSRLNTDHLDSLLLHRPDALMEPEEVGEAFDILKASGKVRSFGVSNMNRYQMELLSSGLNVDLSANQLQMSLVHAPMLEAGFNVNMMADASVMRDGGTLEYCRLKKVVVQTWSPLQIGYFGGVFLKDERYPELNALLDQLAEEQHTTPDAIAYAWLLRYPAKMQVITGTTNNEHLNNAAAAADVVLTKKQWYDLYKAVGRRLP